MKEFKFRFIDRSREAEVLSEIWARNLDLREVDPFADFISLGGHSLVATRIVVEIAERYQLSPDQQDRILAMKTLAEQVEFIEGVRR